MNDAGLEFVDNQSIAAGDLIAGTFLVSNSIDLGPGGSSARAVPLEGSWVVMTASQAAVEDSTAVSCDIKLISCETDDIATNFALTNYRLHYTNVAAAGLFKVESNPVIAFQIPRRPDYNRHLAVVLTFSGGTGLSAGRLNITVQPHCPINYFPNAI